MDCVSYPALTELAAPIPIDVCHGRSDAESTPRYRHVGSRIVRVRTPGPEDERVRARFEELSRLWRIETGLFSQLDLRLGHRAYRSVVLLGEQAIPFILDDLARTGDWWFAALEEITGENPVASVAPGDMRAVACAWLDWGYANGWR